MYNKLLEGCVSIRRASSDKNELEGGKIVQKGVYAKMARGDMVRFMAENQIEEPEELKAYDRMQYHYSPDWSTDTEFVFIREPHQNTV